MRSTNPPIVPTFAIIFLALSVFACLSTPETPETPGSPVLEKTPTTELILPTPTVPSRYETIPSDSIKMSPEADLFPPILHSSEWEDPVPVAGPINTAGGEDSPFISPDGNTLTFFFTPDVKIPAEQQLLDGVTGIYISHKINGEWTEPEKIVLVEMGELSLDGCQFIQGDIMWFCSARLGSERGVDMWTAEFVDGVWTNWKNAGEKLNLDYWLGEMHISSDKNALYFHSDREDGVGGVDIWVSYWIEGEWAEPQNVLEVNTEATDGWPFLSEDGSELWFLRPHQGYASIFRVKNRNGGWGEPELILSQFAGEPSLDREGNIYFVHHYFEEGNMIEADIYVAYRK
jgi:hypothetical protein